MLLDHVCHTREAWGMFSEVQQRCTYVCRRPGHRVSSQICVALWKLWRPQKHKLVFFFLFFFPFLPLFISLTDEWQVVMWCWLEFQNRPPSFHNIFPLHISQQGQAEVRPMFQSYSRFIKTLFRPVDWEKTSHTHSKHTLWGCMIWMIWNKYLCCCVLFRTKLTSLECFEFPFSSFAAHSNLKL